MSGETAVRRAFLLGTRDPSSPLHALRGESDILRMIWGFTKDLLYVVNVRTLAPVYDIHVFVQTSMHDTAQGAIAACRREFVEAVRNNFRDPGETEIYGREFDPQRIEEYDTCHMSELYHNGGQPDASSPYANPGGPAIAQVLEFAKPPGGGWKEHAVIYQLPVSSKPFYRRQRLCDSKMSETDEQEKPPAEPGRCPDCGGSGLDFDPNCGLLFCCQDECEWEMSGDEHDPAVRAHLSVCYPDHYPAIDPGVLVVLNATNDLTADQQMALKPLLPSLLSG
eukprot:TRINITY_DN44814_c0_g2_i1.p1 TRINITY_DN44814_c0_g2~~TRINITY_DN44814_c0_g2_i1.p1  ORF type:complete len:280 (+),score=50.59 TRINITY_DN44814_c0_g2_i1:169-1008(+)